MDKQETTTAPGRRETKTGLLRSLGPGLITGATVRGGLRMLDWVGAV